MLTIKQLLITLLLILSSTFSLADEVISDQLPSNSTEQPLVFAASDVQNGMSFTDEEIQMLTELESTEIAETEAGVIITMYYCMSTASCDPGIMLAIGLAELAVWLSVAG